MARHRSISVSSVKEQLAIARWQMRDRLPSPVERYFIDGSDIAALAQEPFRLQSARHALRSAENRIRELHDLVAKQQDKLDASVAIIARYEEE